MSVPIYTHLNGVQYRFVLDSDRGEVRWELLDENDHNVVVETRILRTAEMVQMDSICEILQSIRDSYHRRRRLDKVSLTREEGV